MGSIWRDYKINIKRSRGLLEETMKKRWKKMKKRDLHEKRTTATWREHEI